MDPVRVALSGNPAVEEARADVLALGLPPDRAFVRFGAPTWPPGLSWLADVVCVHARASSLDVELPRACLLNWNAWLQPHVDRTAPYPCLNAAVVLRHEAHGGALVVGAETFACADADLILFDGGSLHEVTPSISSAPDGYRASVVYYLPLGGPA